MLNIQKSGAAFLRSVLAVLAGAGAGFLTVAFFAMFGIWTALISDNFWAKAVAVLLLYILPCFTAGYVTIKVSRRHDLYLIPGVFMVLVLLVAINNDFRGLGGAWLETLAMYCFILFWLLVGGIAALYRKKKKRPGDPGEL